MVNKPDFTVEQIIGYAEKLSQMNPLGAIFIDYMELIKTANRHASEELRIAYIANQLRIASEKLSTPVIVLAQMNRSSVNEKNVAKRRPKLEGLRYSGRQEQEASTVLGLFNLKAEKLDLGDEDDRYYSDFRNSGRENSEKTILQIIPLKNRGGGSNKPIKLHFEMVSGYIE